MDVLVALGTSAAYFYSVGAVIAAMIAESDQPVSIFFETSVLLIFFILLGKYLESAARGKTTESLSKLVSLQPDTAIIISLPRDLKADSNDTSLLQNGEKKEVPIALVQIGDVVFIPPGSRVPADGIVVFGSSFCDESMITGESRAVAKNIGDNVIGGTVNDGSSVLLLKVLSIGAETALARIVKLVEDALTKKSPIQS
jgi:Cu+-exporting ATPase